MCASNGAGDENVEEGGNASEETPIARVLGGAGWVFGGRIVKLVLGFVVQILVARILGNTSYGGLSIAVSILGFVGLFAGLGVSRGIKRNVSYYEDEPEKARGIVRSGLTIKLASHLVTAVLLFVFAPTIATRVFGNPDLTLLLRIAALGLPFGALRSVGISVATGSRDATTHTVVNQVIGPVARSLLVGGFVLLGFGAAGAILGRTIAGILLSGVAVYLAWRVFPLNVFGEAEPMYGELIRFSLPLMVTAWMTFFIDETDYLLLGVFLTEDLVGTYTAMFGLRPAVLLFFFPATFLLAPVITRLQKEEELGKARKTYQAVSKWTTLLSVPLFLPGLLFPEVVIGVTFGTEYLGGALVLRVLMLSGLVTVLLGANDRVVVGLGHSKTSMYVSGAAAVSNVVLNLVLIPFYGTIGAAVASLFAFAARNLANSVILYRWYGLTPFSRAMGRVLAIVAAVTPLGYLGFVRLFDVTFLSVAAVGVLFLCLYVPLTIRAGASESIDRELFEQVEESRDIDLDPIKRVLNRFQS
jgi:O-antigen/teichoic acid export membrane protein